MSGQVVPYPKDSLALLKNSSCLIADFVRLAPYNPPR